MAASGEYSELRQTEISAAEQLSQYEVISEEQGIYRIPIERSISLIANEPQPASRNAATLQNWRRFSLD